MKRLSDVTKKGTRYALLSGVLIALIAPVGSAHLAGAESTDTSRVRLAAESTRLLAADGSLLANLHGEIDRDPVPLAEIPPHLRNAVISIEDRRFWHHSGIDPRGTIRAFVQNLLPHHQIEGGSTISEQLVKNLYFFGRARTLPRKGEEAILTLGLERLNSKETILESYLNTVYFGRGVYGVQAAAHSYFHTDVRHITVAEAAYLAGLIHAPAIYDAHPADAVVRRNEVLNAMAEQHYITRTQERTLQRSRLAVFPPQDQEWQHPYFVDAALRELGVLRTSEDGPLDKRFDFLGDDPTERAQAVYGGGLRIYTTLDPTAQSSAENAVNEILPSGDYKRLDTALVSVQPGTGYVRALVGGRDYYPAGCNNNTASQACRIAKVNMALGSIAGGSGRQPGSGFKPFVLAALIDNGISLKESVDSSPFTVDFAHGDHWEVDNYEGESAGVVDITDATVHSINAAYAHIETDLLGDGDALVGAHKVAAEARKLGIPFPTQGQLEKSCGKAYRTNDTCTPADQVPAIALGAKEVAPIDMAAAYATFAAQGMYAPPTTIAKITDATGKVLYQAKPRARRAIPRDTALGVDAVLQQVVERGTGVAAQLDRPVAGKTGTSEGWRDAWFNGYTPQLATTVWVGNPVPVQDYDGSWSIESMTPDNGYPLKIVGGTFPAEIWHDDMKVTTAKMPVVAFPPAPDKLYGPPKHPVVPAGPAVPNVVGLNVTDAQITLQNAGFAVGVQQICQQAGNNAGPLTVWGQRTNGSGVTLMVNDAVC